MAQPKEIFVRLDRCMGCHSCELACAVEHSQSKSLYSAISEKPTPQSRVYVEWVAPDNRLPVLCRHCEDAPCMHACICGAISRTEEGLSGDVDFESVKEVASRITPVPGGVGPLTITMLLQNTLTAARLQLTS